MKFYSFSYNSGNIEETGTLFQSINGIFGDIQNGSLPFEGKIDQEFALPEIYLEKKAKHTDLLNSVIIPPWFLVLKKGFIDFLNNYKLDEIQSWNIKVHQNKLIYDEYSLFFLNFPKQDEVINFRESDFYIGKYSEFQYEGERMTITSYSEYLQKRKKLESLDGDLLIKFRSILLDLKNIKTDLFRIINAPLSGYYVSEKLKTAIIEKGFTGIEFKEINEMNKRVKIDY